MSMQKLIIYLFICIFLQNKHIQYNAFLQIETYSNNDYNLFNQLNIL